MTTPPEIAQNLTSQLDFKFGDITTDNLMSLNDFISDWCYSQHFEFQYRAVYLIWTASLFLLIYTLMIQYDDRIPDFKYKVWLWDIDKAEVRSFFFTMGRECIVIFLFIFLYEKYDWHFLDGLLSLLAYK